jgi:hypothetical protein
MLGDSVFSFSDLDSAWPNYKNLPIFIQGQNKKFKFVLQCNQNSDTEMPKLHFIATFKLPLVT